jgi:hypothetical protein
MTDEIQTNGPSPEAVDLPSETDEITTTTGDRAIEIVEEDPTRTTIPVGLPEATDGLEKIRVRTEGSIEVERPVQVGENIRTRIVRREVSGSEEIEISDEDRETGGVFVSIQTAGFVGLVEMFAVYADPEVADVEVYSEVFGLEESDEE